MKKPAGWPSRYMPVIRPTRPPTHAPTKPTIIVIIRPPCSRPGINMRANRPMISPKMACPIMCNIQSFLPFLLWRSQTVMSGGPWIRRAAIGGDRQHDRSECQSRILQANANTWKYRTGEQPCRTPENEQEVPMNSAIAVPLNNFRHTSGHAHRLSAARYRVIQTYDNPVGRATLSQVLGRVPVGRKPQSTVLIDRRCDARRSNLGCTAVRAAI